MDSTSHHPELKVMPELREAVERVASGIEPVIVLTDDDGTPRAAIVPLTALRQLDELDAAKTDQGEREDSDTTGLHLR